MNQKIKNIFKVLVVAVFLSFVVATGYRSSAENISEDKVDEVELKAAEEKQKEDEKVVKKKLGKKSNKIKSIMLDKSLRNSRSKEHSGVIIDGKEIKKKAYKNKLNSNQYQLVLSDDEESALIKRNIEIDENGGNEDDIIPLSIEEQSVEEAEADTGSTLMALVDGVLSTKTVNAAVKVTKVNWCGAGYEVYKQGSNILYCVHYGPLAGVNYNKYNDFKNFLNKKLSWSESKINKMTHVALWGTYYYQKNKNYGYVASAQSIIWGNKYHPGATTAKKKAINTRVSKHATNVSFTKQTKTLKAGSSITLTDSKGELGWFTFANQTAFTNATGIKVSKSGNKVILTNPANNTKSVKSTLVFDKYKDTGFQTGKGYGLYSGNQQELAQFTYIDPVRSTLNVQAQALDYGKLKLTKDMDDEDLYDKLILGTDGNPIYLTADGKHKVIEGLTIDTLKNPTKAYMVEHDLFEKNITYQYAVLKNKKVLQDKVDSDGNPEYVLDGGGNKIPKIDGDGNQLLDPDGNPLYEIVQEEVNAKDLDGNLIYEPVLDGSGNIQYATRTLSEKYGTEREMDNIYRGEGVEFEVKNSAGVVVYRLKTDSEGEAITENLPVGKYTVKETKTINDFALLTKTYSVTVVKDEVVEVNNGEALVNYRNMANLEIMKVDQLKNTGIANVLFTFYESDNGVCPTSAQEMIKSDEGLIWSGLTDNDGKIEWNTANARTICVAEKETINGYMLNDKVHTVELKLNDTAKIVQENNTLKVKLHIKKLGYEGVILPGTKFKLSLFDPSDELVKEYEELIVDEEGYIHVEYNSLNPFFDEYGNSYKHVLEETEALEDYTLKEPIQFYIAMSEDGKVELSKDEFTFLSNITGDEEQEVEIIVNNELKHTYGKLIKKSKNDNERQVATYKFDYYDHEDKLVESKEYKSRKEGVETSFPVYFKLTKKVCATEVQPPQDHILNEETKCLETKDYNENKVMIFEFYNDRMSLAKTGWSWLDLFN